MLGDDLLQASAGFGANGIVEAACAKLQDHHLHAVGSTVVRLFAARVEQCNIKAFRVKWLGLACARTKQKKFRDSRGII